MDEWKSKREEILEKYNHQCAKCRSNKSITLYSGGEKLYATKINGEFSLSVKKFHLEIHHEYYVNGLLPWEYDDALITVCNFCHEEIHLNEEIYIYNNKIRVEAILAERSKAVRSGRTIFGCVSSNLTDCIFCLIYIIIHSIICLFLLLLISTTSTIQCMWCFIFILDFDGIG